MNDGRLKRLQEQLGECAAYIVEEPINLTYLTGLAISHGMLVVKKNEYLFIVDGRYIEAASRISFVKSILLKEGALKEALQGCKRVGFDSAKTSYERFLELSKLDVEWVASPDVVLKLRAVKEEEELKALREAARLGSEGYEFVLTRLKEGVTEREVARALEIFWLEKGGEKLAFDSIIAFGPHSSMPHYRSGGAALKRGDPVLIDIGVVKNQYHSDMTRVVFFGEPAPVLKEIYAAVKEAQELALKACSAGKLAKEVDQAARQCIADRGYGELSHGLGHGVGLEIHELPVLRSKSPHGELIIPLHSVVTIEPGIYLPGIGGVRIEDTVIVLEKGVENLTTPSKELRIL